MAAGAAAAAACSFAERRATSWSCRPRSKSDEPAIFTRAESLKSGLSVEMSLLRLESLLFSRLGSESEESQRSGIRLWSEKKGIC